MITTNTYKKAILGLELGHALTILHTNGFIVLWAHLPIFFTDGNAETLSACIVSCSPDGDTCRAAIFYNLYLRWPGRPIQSKKIGRPTAIDRLPSAWIQASK